MIRNYKEEARLARIAERGTDEESREAIDKLKKIDPTYHFCMDWDDMVICCQDLEYRCCNCHK